MDRLCLAHWGEHVNGGGDRVAWELARTFPDAPLYVGWRNPSIEPDGLDIRELSGGHLSDRAMECGGVARMLAHLFKWQVAPELREYDTLITSGNEPLFYVVPDTQTWISYVHHTNRRQSDLITEIDTGGISGSAKIGLYYLIRVLFDHNTHRPDHYVANSEIVRHRIHKYWGIPRKKISVVYPPVPTDQFSPENADTSNYYLTLSRLDWHKNIDEIIGAFNGMPDQELYIAGDGPIREELEKRAEGNITFLGYVNEAEKRRLLSEAKAFVFAGREEDFGISPIEALAAGTPLLGVKEGMTQFQVINGKNGYTHVRPGEDGTSLQDSVVQLEENGVTWSEQEIESFAERFSVESFRDQIRAIVEDTEKESRLSIVPHWYEEYANGT